MHVTLHLTDQCNLDCSYCVHEKRNCVMSETVLNAACDYIFQSGTTAGICFFGGEPLLEKGLLQKAVTRCQQHAIETGIPFQCKMTTNGTLLDKAFIQYAKSIGMQIGLSFDGTGQDRCRRYRDGSGTFSDLERNAKLLLEQLPNSYAMMTIAPEAVDTYTDSVKYLYRLGFRNMNATLAYGKRVHWTDAHLEQLQAELQKTADFYEQQFLQGTLSFRASANARYTGWLAVSLHTIHQRPRLFAGRCFSRAGQGKSSEVDSSGSNAEPLSGMCLEKPLHKRLRLYESAGNWR